MRRCLIEILCKAFNREWQTGAAKQNGKQIASNRPGRSCRIFGLPRGPSVTAFLRDAFSARKAPSERMVIMNMTAPLARPARPYFSSGPCAKRPGWQIQNLQNAPLGRSHRAKAAKTRLKLGVELTREILQVPADYRIGIVPGRVRSKRPFGLCSATAASMCSPGSLLAKAGSPISSSN